MGGNTYSPMEANKAETSCCHPMPYSVYILITLLLYNTMSRKQDGEDAVRVTPGLLEGIKGDYRIVEKLGNGEQAIVSASLSAFPSGLSSREPHSRKRVRSPFYTAQEVFAHHISLVPWTGKIDVWSLGMIGLEFVWGLPQRPQHGLGFHPNSPYANGWQGAI